jgi:hypothetical protein
MNRVDTIDPKSVTVTVAGAIIEGFSPDMIKVARDSNQIEDEVGPDGDVARRVTNDRRGSITLTLLQTSRSNLVLSSLAIADELSGNILFPVIIKDQRGNDLYIAATAWIRKMPEATYRAAVEHRVWEIRTNYLNMFVGGAASA